MKTISTDFYWTIDINLKMSFFGTCVNCLYKIESKENAGLVCCLCKQTAIDHTRESTRFVGLLPAEHKLWETSTQLKQMKDQFKYWHFEQNVHSNTGTQNTSLQNCSNSLI